MSVLLRVTAACWVLAVLALTLWAFASPASLPLAVVAAFAVGWGIVLLGARLIGGQGWDDARAP
ncbi:MAG TPA: hypothetical protein VFE37_09190 [Chloroflexota bacterium]|nr:hypothetical protein [Chloroflexota bacterium]